LGDGSYLLKHQLKDGQRYWIRIVGPTDPDIEEPVKVLHSNSPEDANSFKVMSQSEIRSFVASTLKSQRRLSRAEGGFIAVLLCHGDQLAKIRFWGFGIASIEDGDWTKVFQDPNESISFTVPD
jgi:hypothetical protein